MAMCIRVRMGYNAPSICQYIFLAIKYSVFDLHHLYMDPIPLLVVSIDILFSHLNKG